MSIWFLINLLLFIFVIVKIATGHIAMHTIIGGIGVVLILYNWTRHAVFATIRSKKVARKRKIKFARLSKKLNRIHKWTGSTALIVILIHAAIVMHYFGFQANNVKMLSGLFAVFILAGVVIFGWLRFIRTTVARRYIHWGLAFALIFLVVVHLVL